MNVHHSKHIIAESPTDRTISPETLASQEQSVASDKRDCRGTGRSTARSPENSGSGRSVHEGFLRGQVFGFDDFLAAVLSVKESLHVVNCFNRISPASA